MPDSRCHPGLSAAGEPGRSPPPAQDSAAAHSPDYDGPPTVPAELWSDVEAEAQHAGLDPLVLLCMLARRGLEAMARMRKNLTRPNGAR